MLRSAKLYTVHLPPSDAKDDEPVFIREGFSWPAFVFGVFWALYHRLWFVAAGIFAAQLALVALEEESGLLRVSILILQLGMQALIGFHANDWWRDSLRKRNYLIADIVSGESELRAEQRYFERHA